MLFSTIGQAWAFLGAVYGGVAIGVIYDATRIIRILLKAGRKATIVIDIVFWLVAAAAMFLTIWWIGAHEVRAYMFLGFACGWALYTIAISTAAMRIFFWLRKAAKSAARTKFAKRILK